MSPGKSINSIGMYLHPSVHFELRGLSLTLNSGWTQSVIAYPIEVDGFFVVKGYVEISVDDKVAELKKVVFPVFVLPMRPILIGMDKRRVQIIYLCCTILLFIF